MAWCVEPVDRTRPDHEIVFVTGDVTQLSRLVLPNSIGVLAALGILSFINSWNAFLWPLVIGQNPSSWTIQIVLSTYITAQTINLPYMFMGAVVGALPLVIVFLVMQRYIVEGVRLSGIKG